MNVPARVICILGMHRSGTSCLTGSLQQAGLFLGKHHTWNPHNLKGNRENEDIVAFNDSLLAANDGAWDAPPRHVYWDEAHTARARELLADYSDEDNLGFKDPRTLLALDGWKDLIPDIRCVGIFRHPNAVARSLEVRSGSEMSRGQALGLWYGYNRRLLRAYRQNAFPVLCFDEPEALFHEKLDRVVSELGFQVPANGERFYSDDLRNAQNNVDVRLPWKVSRLYKHLCSIAR